MTFLQDYKGGKKNPCSTVRVGTTSPSHLPQSSDSKTTVLGLTSELLGLSAHPQQSDSPISSPKAGRAAPQPITHKPKAAATRQEVRLPGHCRGAGGQRLTPGTAAHLVNTLHRSHSPSCLHVVPHSLSITEGGPPARLSEVLAAAWRGAVTAEELLVWRSLGAQRESVG